MAWSRERKRKDNDMMPRRRFLSTAAALAALPLCGGGRGVRAREGGASWSYGGATGPDAWGTLDPAYGACARGVRQSPVDLKAATPAMMATPDIDWPAMPLAIRHTGKALVVEATAYATMGLGVEGERWRLTEIRFHHPSEHTVDGRGFPLEIQFVHENQLGDGLAVAAVFVRSGRANPVLRTVFDAMPRTAGQRVTRPTLITPALLLPPPEARETWRYHGSLTTPPCTEGVRWVVFTQPVEAAPAQIRAFAGLFPMNARPTQPLGRRYLLLDFF